MKKLEASKKRSRVAAQDGSNRLPILAAEIMNAHAEARRAAQMTVEHAIRAGEALIEAKGIMKHGEWLPWLRDNCQMSERSAQLYMQVARRKEELQKRNVADLSLRAAARAVSDTITDDDVEVAQTADPLWLERKLARICGMPDHVRNGLMIQMALGMPALAMLSGDDLVKAIILLKPYVAEWAISTTDRGIESLITAQGMIVALWTELVDNRQGLDNDAWWQRAQDVAEQVKAGLAEMQRADADA